MPRFVLLEHAWDGTHWDFMLEGEAALRTWSLARHPGESLGWVEARALADHRLAYLEYEGPISRGRGAVRCVDRGVYDWLEDTASLVRVAVRGESLRGLIELERLAPDPDGFFLWRARYRAGDGAIL